ncbi:hypothetical protein R6Q57_005605 [Mikania cordata]
MVKHLKTQKPNRSPPSSVQASRKLTTCNNSFGQTAAASSARDQLKHGSGASNPARFQPSQHPRVLFVLPDSISVPVEDAQDKNESRTMSWDSMEFYNNGDAPYCYSRILGLNKLHTDFWGVLLGYLNDGRLYAIHIEGWVRRMMFLRGATKRTNPSTEFDWTILPPQFHSEMYDYTTKLLRTGYLYKSTYVQWS